MKKSKIFMLSLFTFVTLFFVKTNVYADVTCPSLGSVVIDDAIPNVVSMIIKVIQIAVPILLVIMGSIDLIKGITSQKEDEIKKGQQIFIKRLIAGALVFFVIAIVKLVISAVAGDKDNIMTCACHFFNGANDSSCVKE